MAYRQLQATPIPPGSIIYILFVLAPRLNETRVRVVPVLAGRSLFTILLALVACVRQGAGF